MLLAEIYTTGIRSHVSKALDSRQLSGNIPQQLIDDCKSVLSRYKTDGAALLQDPHTLVKLLSRINHNSSQHDLRQVVDCLKSYSPSDND